MLVGIDGVVGSRFSDVLTGNLEPTWCWGGSGNDSMSGRWWQRHRQWWCRGRHGELRRAPAAVTASLSTRQGGRGGHGPCWLGIDGVVGSRFSDMLTGNAGANMIQGGELATIGGSGRGGNDRISGQAGKDVLKGHGGNDALNGGVHFDRGNGGTGSDTQVRCEVVVQIPSHRQPDHQRSGCRPRPRRTPTRRGRPCPDPTIWAVIVATVDTNPAQMGEWHESRPDDGRPANPPSPRPTPSRRRTRRRSGW